MTPEQWTRVKQVFNAALAQDASTRAAFVADATAGDEPVRTEVERLLDADLHAADFIEHPAAATLHERPRHQSLRDRAPARQRRHGARLRRARYRARPRGGAESRVARQPRRAGQAAPGSAARVAPQPSAHLPRLRRWPRRWPAVHRHGAGPGPIAGRCHPGRAAVDRECEEIRHRDRRRARARPRTRRDPPRPEEHERDDHGPRRQGARLRAGADTRHASD